MFERRGTTLRPARPTADGPGSVRLPPHNLEAEESVLGACLLSRQAIANVLEVVGPNDFYKPAHTEAFQAMLDLYARGEPVDAVTLPEELRRRGTLEEIGGKSFIFTLVSSVPTPGSATHYARIVGDHAVLRRLIEAASTISDVAYGVPDDVEHAVDLAEDLVYQVTHRRVSEDFRPIRDLLTENMELVEKLAERGSSITGLATGFHDLDELTAGLQPSNLIIVAARPSMGKSSLAVSMAQHCAVSTQTPVVIFSLEMSKMELVQRLMCAEARVDSNRLRRGALSDSDWPKLAHALGRLAEAPIFIDDTPNVTIMEMRAKCRRLASKSGLGLVIVDYLQLMQALRHSDNRVQEVSEISRSLKILARDLEVPVIAVSQLSRNVEYRADKRPLLADLRESGCLTADTRLLRADTGQWVEMGELCSKGERDIPVWTVNEDLKIVRGTMTHVFCSGIKRVFRMKLRSGREIKASANHPFLTFDGWRPLDELSTGERLAIPRSIPEHLNAVEWPDDLVVLLAHLIGDGCFVERQPLHYTNNNRANLEAVRQAAKAFGVCAREVRQEGWFHLYLPAASRVARGTRNPIVQWLDDLELYGKRSYEKFVPQEVFSLSNRQIALFLRHLWATDGHASLQRSSSGRAPTVFYATTSKRLADDVAHLLLRLGVVARIRSNRKRGYRVAYQVFVGQSAHLRRFVELVGGFGPRAPGVEAIRARIEVSTPKAHHDTVPPAAWERVRALTNAGGLSLSQVERGAGAAIKTETSVSRELLERFANYFSEGDLFRLAQSDVFWDEVIDIESLGDEPVFDATVPSTHNFIADGIIVENSIEQDADLVMFIYRDEVYNPDTAQKGIAEIHIAKHRNGPIGKLELAFLDHYTKFANLARGM
ncbi:MAG: replicative DNA helicase [Actinomycetota bacterium]